MHVSEVLSGFTTWPLLSIYLLALAIVLYGYRPVQRWRVRNIPGRPPRWFLGNLSELRAGGPAKVHQQWAQEYGPVFTSFGGSQPFVFTDHPELVRQVLIQHTARPSFPSIWLGAERDFDRASILAVRGEKHRSIRGAWTPMFFSGSLEAYSALMNEATELLLANIALAAKEGRAIDIHKAIGDMTLQVVGTTAFGIDFNTQEDHKAKDKPMATDDSSAQRLKDAVSSIFSVSPMNFSAYTPIMFLFPFTAPLVRILAAEFPDRSLRKMMASRKVVVDSVADLIRQHRKVLAEEVAGKQGGEAESMPQWREDTLHMRKGVAPGSFLDLLMRTKDRTTGRGFTDVELASQAYVMILAGFETTANALGFTLYLLAANPDAQERLAAEVDGVLGASGHASYQDLERMPWMDACLKEGLRLFPPAPTIVREAARDTDIGGYAVRKGQWLGCAVYSMHRNPKYWQDPERFIPERWLEGTPEAVARPAHGWAPFGDGVRACIGTRFALAEAKTTLARLYQRFTFKLEPGQEPLAIRNTITISPKHGVHVRAIPRTMQIEP